MFQYRDRQYRRQWQTVCYSALILYAVSLNKQETSIFHRESSRDKVTVLSRSVVESTQDLIGLNLMFLKLRL